MFVKLAVVSCLVAAATAVWNGPLAGGVPASQYPAGVSPQACPNFPNCANPAVAANPNAAVPYGAYNPGPYNSGQYNPGPQYNAAPVPQYNQYQGSQNALDRGEYTGDGDYHGEGLAESGAYGNAAGQGAYNQAPAYNAAPAYNHGLPAGVGQPAQIPAGVDARACPNYPFCH